MMKAKHLAAFEQLEAAQIEFLRNAPEEQLKKIMDDAERLELAATVMPTSASESMTTIASLACGVICRELMRRLGITQEDAT